jgi:hypothetical protein
MKKSGLVQSHNGATAIKSQELMKQYDITSEEVQILMTLDFDFEADDPGKVKGIELDDIEMALYECIEGRKMAIQMLGINAVKAAGGVDIEKVKGIFKKYSQQKFEKLF